MTVANGIQAESVHNTRIQHIRAILVLILLFSLLTFFYGRFVIQSDGISYYAFALSLLKDGDVDLENQYAELPEIRSTVSQSTRKIASYYSCGFGYLYFPFLYISELVSNTFPRLQDWRPYSQNVRFPAAHGLAVLSGSLFYGFSSVLLGYWILSRQLKCSTFRAAFIVFSCFVGTSLMFYTMTVPSFAHASDSFLVAAAFFLTIQRNHFSVGKIRFRNVILGALLALLVLLRNNNIVIVPMLVLSLLFIEKKEGFRRGLLTCMEILAGALPFLIVHIRFNMTQYGTAVATGYQLPVPAHVRWRVLHFLDIIFHPVAGLYSWSPITALATLGLIYGAWKRRTESVVALVLVIVVVVSIRLGASVFPGATFGQRLLTHLYVCWVVGLFELFTLLPRLSGIISTVFIIWTFLFFNLYFVLSSTKDTRYVLTRRGGAPPVVWMATVANQYHRLRESGKVSGPMNFMYEALGAPPYPTIQHILFNQRSGT